MWADTRTLHCHSNTSGGTARVAPQLAHSIVAGGAFISSSLRVLRTAIVLGMDGRNVSDAISDRAHS